MCEHVSNVCVWVSGWLGEWVCLFWCVGAWVRGWVGG